MKKLMWYGLRGSMMWVPCPQAGSTVTLSGSADSATTLSGNAFVRKSLNRHQRIPLTWSLTDPDLLQPVFDLARGMYGDGLVYWSDPFTAHVNALPFGWSVPSLGGYDGVILNGGDDRPSLVPTGTPGMPKESAVYTVNPADWMPEVWIPIPPGHTAHVGWIGASSGGVVNFYPTMGENTNLTPVTAPAINAASGTLVNASIANDGTTDGVLVRLGGTGTMTVTGITVQILANGEVPNTGAFRAGNGHGGCELIDITQERYSAALGLVGASADYVEVGGR